jgi:hypothetical protein
MNNQVTYEEEGGIAKCDWIEACLFLKKPLAMFPLGYQNPTKNGKCVKRN